MQTPGIEVNEVVRCDCCDAPFSLQEVEFFESEAEGQRWHAFCPSCDAMVDPDDLPRVTTQ